jgi:multiple antibiotic resistance protein
MFMTMTPHDTDADRARQAKRACVIAFIVLSIFGIAGERLLHALGTGLPAMKVAGGILLSLAAADMVTARGELRTTRVEQQAATRTDDVSVFPLGIPLIAGPGAMTTMVLLQSSVRYEPLGMVAIEAALIVAVGITLAALLVSRWLGRLLGKTDANVAGRVLGVLLAALAAQITLDGLRESLWRWVTSVKLVEIRNVAEVPNGAVAPMELSARRTLDGTFDGAATAIAAVKPCAFGAPLRGCGA